MSRLIYNNYVNATQDSFAGCSALKTITVGGTSIGGNSLGSCSALENLEFADTVKTINSQALQFCYALRRIKFSSQITTLSSSAFYGLDYVKIYDFSSAIAVPTLNSMLTTAYDAKIIVPDALYDDWIVATNWAAKADYIYKASEVQL